MADGAEHRSAPSSRTFTKDLPAATLSKLADYWDGVGLNSAVLPENYSSKDFHSSLIRGVLTLRRLERRRITCLLVVKPPVVNFYGTLHGGAVAAVAEMVAIACARTVVAGDVELFLGEMSISYLSAAPRNAELLVDGHVVKSGRAVTATAVEFKLLDGRLAYTAHATFYLKPAAKL